MFVAGFGDGVVRLFDKRAEDAGEVVLRTWRQHKIWIQSVHLQKGSMRELVTGRSVYVILEKRREANIGIAWTVKSGSGM